MNSSLPVLRQISWIGLFTQLLVLMFFLQLSIEVFPESGINYGFISFIIISISLKYFIAKSHRKGISHFKKGNYLEAIKYFENSYLFFTKNTWIDKFRFLTLLSPSKISYKEMALNNIAFCYGQAGNGTKAKEYYAKTINEFPDSGIAKAGLNLLNAGENTNI